MLQELDVSSHLNIKARRIPPAHRFGIHSLGAPQQPSIVAFGGTAIAQPRLRQLPLPRQQHQLLQLAGVMLQELDVSSHLNTKAKRILPAHRFAIHSLGAPQRPSIVVFGGTAIAQP
jgi:hypothetical protein